MCPEGPTIQSTKGVVETVFLDWGLSFGTGLLFAMAGRPEITAARSYFSTRAFRWGLAYLHLGVIAISVPLYLLHRDWMWMYWVDASTLPVAVHIVAFALYEVCFLAGFMLGAELVPKVSWTIAGGMFVAISTTEVVTRTRLFHLGTFEEFSAGRAPAAIAGGHVEAAWWLVSIGGVASTVALVVALRRLYRRSRGFAAVPAGDASTVPVTP